MENGMFREREDRLGFILLPFHVAAVVLAIVSVFLREIGGWLLVPALIGGWIGWFVILILLFLLVLFIVSLMLPMKKPVEKNHPGARRVVLYVLGLLCRVVRLRVHLHGEDELPEGRWLLVSNHRSSYDPIATGWALRRHQLTFVTKPEILRIPIAGPWIYRANYLPINRADPRKAMATIQAAAHILREDWSSVGIYPEGTRSGTGEMLPFHNGVFKIAQKANVPIVVVSVKGTENIWKRFPLRATDITVRVCAVIPADEVKTSSGAALGTKVREVLENSLSGKPTSKTEISAAQDGN